MVWVYLLDDIYRTLAADRVEPAALSIVKEIVGIGRDIDRGDEISGIGVQDQEPGGPPTADE